MGPAELLLEAFSRIPDEARASVDGLDGDQLAARPDSGANSIAWLVWHLARQQDAQVAPLAGIEQVWSAGAWADRFALDLDTGDIGFGHDAAQVATVKAPAELLLGYLDAVQEQTRAYVATLSGDDLDRVIDGAWDPPVTVGVRLVSVVDDCSQHAGQAGYLRGLLGRAG